MGGGGRAERRGYEHIGTHRRALRDQTGCLGRAGGPAEVVCLSTEGKKQARDPHAGQTIGRTLPTPQVPTPPDGDTRSGDRLQRWQ